jgi:hypothetical protein
MLQRGPLGCSQLNLSHRGTSDLVVIETTLASHRRIKDQARPSLVHELAGAAV